MVEVVYKNNQIEHIAKELNITKLEVDTIITQYTDYLIEMLNSGKSVKILNVCYMKADSKYDQGVKTLAYVSTELAKEIGLSPIVVHRVLTCFEDYIIYNIKKSKSYAIRSLVKIRLIQTDNGELRVRSCKSKRFANKGIRVCMLGSFKRKVESA